VTRPADEGCHRKRGHQDEEGQYHVHGSNYSAGYIPPTSGSSAAMR
jgi:hypothetical protein